MTDWYDEDFRGAMRHGLAVERRIADVRSPFQRIEVFDSRAYGRVLALDGVFQTSEADEHVYHEMLVHPVMTLAPRVRRVLVIGGGDGGTVREVLRHDEVERVVMVEIDARVVEICREHLASIGTSWDDRRLELRFEDGVRFVCEADVEPFDVVLLDGSDPVGPAEGLFGRAFYEGARRMLVEGGLFCAQSESPFLFREVFADIVRTAREVFGEARPCFAPVPLYAAGPWSFTVAGARVDPAAIVERRAEAVERVTRYWNREIHDAAFAVPSELRGIVRAERG